MSITEDNSVSPDESELKEGSSDNASAAVSQPKPTDKEYPRLNRPEPTRYGDWEKSGRCIDF